MQTTANGTVRVAEGDGWALDMDPTEWELLTIRERTSLILGAWVEQDLMRPQSDEREGLVQYLKDEKRLQDLVWAAWQLLPYRERRILKEQRVRIRCEPLEEDVNGITRHYVTADEDRRFLFQEVTIDASHAMNGSDDEILSTILHELAHVSFRHLDVSNCTLLPEEYQESLSKAHEFHAFYMSHYWREETYDHKHTNPAGTD